MTLVPEGKAENGSHAVTYTNTFQTVFWWCYKTNGLLHRFLKLSSNKIKSGQGHKKVPKTLLAQHEQVFLPYISQIRFFRDFDNTTPVFLFHLKYKNVAIYVSSLTFAYITTPCDVKSTTFCFTVCAIIVRRQSVRNVAMSNCVSHNNLSTCCHQRLLLQLYEGPDIKMCPNVAGSHQSSEVPET